MATFDRVNFDSNISFSPYDIFKCFPESFWSRLRQVVHSRRTCYGGGSSGSATTVPPRAAGTPVLAYTRGCMRQAIQIAADPITRDSAIQELKERAYSNTNRGPQAQKLKTWAEVAQAAGHPNPFEPTPELIYSIAAALWRAGCRSLDGYLSIARQHMVLEHGSIPEALKIHFKHISRAAARGRGPPRQAAVLPFSRLQQLADSQSPSRKTAHASRAVQQWWPPGGCFARSSLPISWSATLPSQVRPPHWFSQSANRTPPAKELHAP